MHTWTAFSADQPEMAGRARAILTATTNAVLGTIRADGSPRLSGIDPFFVDDDLWIGSMPNARKGADIARDQRIALHSVPWESRPSTPEGIEIPAADVKISAHATRITDVARQAQIMAAFAADRGLDVDNPAEPDSGSEPEPESEPQPEAEPDSEQADLFAIDLVSVVLTGVADDMLVIERWSPTNGLTVTRRS